MLHEDLFVERAMDELVGNLQAGSE